MPDAIKDTTVMIHFNLTEIASSFHTSQNSTSSFKCANIGAKSPRLSLPAVCTIFSLILFSSNHAKFFYCFSSNPKPSFLSLFLAYFLKIFFQPAMLPDYDLPSEDLWHLFLHHCWQKCRMGLSSFVTNYNAPQKYT